MLSCASQVLLDLARPCVPDRCQVSPVMDCLLSSFRKCWHSMCLDLSETHHPSGAGNSAMVSEPRLGVRPVDTAHLCLPGLGAEVGEKPAPWEGTARPHPTHVPASGQDVPSWADPSLPRGRCHCRKD
uniref:Uncharacterized protein n=1 Tax=Pipistrellus kuhlii TaxID=59472 RepID=A0A7J7RD17_PIPKU|nr:hypothetical protein mPipKuh1_010690 [Pipistrellus kuhlii]